MSGADVRREGCHGRRQNDPTQARAVGMKGKDVQGPTLAVGVGIADIEEPLSAGIGIEELGRMVVVVLGIARIDGGRRLREVVVDDEVGPALLIAHAVEAVAGRFERP